ncbi:MAG: TetR/AcrR family transcriptional regulator [Alphaproteobacteria bacterium]|nr:TetR/AcrR family transcriptional regulator [Alphaproteobacteria bacterium]
MNDESPLCRQGRPKDTVKHEEIVLAATKLFMEKGYELTSMEAVARLAGVSKLTIYSHFADKKELFRAIVQMRCDKIGMPVCLLDYAQMPVEDALWDISRAAMAKIMTPDSVRLIRVIHAEVLHHPEIAGIYYEVGPRRVRMAFADLLRAFNRLGKLSVPDPATASDQFFSLLKGEMLQRVLMSLSPLPEAAELEAHIKQTIDFFLAAYGPKNPPPATKAP